MAHEILNDNFFAYKTGGWHRLGKVSMEEKSAMQVLQEDFEKLVVTREPIWVHLPDGRQIEVPGQYVLLRHPGNGDSNLDYESFGVVGPEYQEVDHYTAARIWDEHVGAPVETMGWLKGGRAQFITTPLPHTMVKDDEVAQYLTYLNWIESGFASTVYVTGVRAVCRNTVRMGMSQATEMLRLVHDATIRQRTAEWLRGAYQRSLAKLPGMSEDMNRMADYALRPTVNSNAKQDILKVVETAYQFPDAPREDAPPDVLKGRWERYELLRDSIKARRAASVKLFLGAATGFEKEAFKGTMWGLYQSIAQLEDRRRGGNDVQKATAVMIGSRGETIARAWDTAMEIVNQN